MGSLDSFEVFWVQSGSPCGPLGSTSIIGFTRFRVRGRLDSSSVVGFTLVCPKGRWFHKRSLRSLKFTLGVAGFICRRWVHSGSSFRGDGYIRIRVGCVRQFNFKFAQFAPRGSRVHSGSGDYTRAYLGVVGIIPDHLRLLGREKVSSG